MSRPSRIAIVKELGARTPRCLAAHAARPGEEPELVVVERYPAALGESALASLEADTKVLLAFDHPNVATLIASVRLKGDLAVLSEWVDGESVESVLGSASKPPLPLLLRMLSDVADALVAFHARNPGRVLGALAASDVFVGVDGVTRITRFNLGGLAPDVLGPQRMGSMAPEYVRGERSERADVYALGTLWFECFTGERYAPGARVDVGKREPWAAELAAVIERAVAVDPSERFATVSDLASAVSRVVASHVGTRAAVSQYVARTFGENIQARLAKLEPKVDISLSNVPPPVSEPPPPVAPTAPAALPKIAEPSPSAPAVAAPQPAPPKPEPAKPEPAKPEPAKPEPAKPVAAKPIEKTPKQPEAAKHVAPARKPAASAPEIAAPVKKAAPVPLPKRQPSQPDSAPSLAAAAAAEPAPKKTNGAAPAKTAPAAPKPKVAAPPPPEPVKASAPEPPAAPDEDLAIDIDLASVRPPPVAPVAPKKKSVRPPAQQAEAPKPKPKSVRPPAQTSTDDDVFPKRNPYKGPLVVLGALVLAAASFAAGRLTAPEPWQPPPYVPTANPTTAPTPTPRPTPTPTQADTHAVATATTSSASALPSSEPTPRVTAPPVIAPPQTSSSAHYDPNGI